MSILFRRPAAVEEQRAITSVPFNVDSIYQQTAMESALRLAPVYAAVSLISNAIITLPFKAYRETAAGKVVLPVQPKLVADPGQNIFPFAWRGQYVSSILLRGNAYGFWTAGDKIVWLNPDAVRVDESGQVPRYFLSGQELDYSSVVHIPGLVLPGSCVGLSPLTLFRKQIEAGLDSVAAMSNVYRNGGPSAMLQNTKQTLTQEQSDIIKRRFRATIKAGDLLVAGSDWKYDRLGLAPEDAQFVETAKLTATTIAGIFGVPPEEIGGDTGTSMTYMTLEQNDIKFTRRGMQPWTSRLEQAITYLLPRPQYAKFNLDAYVRTDLMTRMNAHQVALNAGIETNEEARALEDRLPLTPDEVAFWTEHYSKAAAPAPAPGGGTA